MLNVQKYLRDGNPLESLKDKWGIEMRKHEFLPLVILNYSQEDSPQNHEIADECRALTLEISPQWLLVARSFKRFWNLEQQTALLPLFNWKNFESYEKVDGSLVVLYNYMGEWMWNTRRTFAGGTCGESGKTWSELFWQILPRERVKEFCNYNISYVFEFTSIWNKVTTHYEKPALYLLTQFYNEGEFSQSSSDILAEKLQVNRPERFHFTSLDEVIAYVKELERQQILEEGIIVYDGTYRWKIKND